MIRQGGDSCTDFSPPGWRGPEWICGRYPLCWPPQQPSKVATVSQIAAPQDGEVPNGSAAGTHYAGSPSSPRKWRQFHRSQPPRMARSRMDLRQVPTMLAPPAALESGDSFTNRSPPGWRGLIWVCGGYPLCWLPQQPSKVATVSQIAAPQDERRGEARRRRGGGREAGGMETAVL